MDVKIVTDSRKTQMLCKQKQDRVSAFQGYKRNALVLSSYENSYLHLGLSEGKKVANRFLSIAIKIVTHSLQWTGLVQVLSYSTRTPHNLGATQTTCYSLLTYNNRAECSHLCNKGAKVLQTDSNDGR